MRQETKLPPQQTVIAGSAGRMGQALVSAVLGQPEKFRLHGALEHVGHPGLGKDSAGSFGQTSGVVMRSDVALVLKGADVLIDFTRPEGSLYHLALCADQGIAVVLGTTGFTSAQKQQIYEMARRIPIVFAPNMSVGVNVLINLVQVAASVLQEAYDVEVIEAHHKHKVDAPSGTALRLGEAVATALHRDFAQTAVFVREGITGERPPGAIGFSTVRAGDIVGEHTVLFAGEGERIELTHKATSRATFALGALRAAEFLRGHRTGLFDMQDVLNLRA